VRQLKNQQNEKIPAEMGSSHGSAYNIIYDELRSTEYVTET